MSSETLNTAGAFITKDLKIEYYYNFNIDNLSIRDLCSSSRYRSISIKRD